MKSKAVWAIAIGALVMSTVAQATTRIQKLGENRYLISHQKQTRFGNQGKARRMLNVKAASLCMLKGGTYFLPKAEEVQGQNWARGATGSVEVRIFRELDEEKKDDLIECKGLATEEQMRKMEKQLKEIGDH